jgi:hypothetical protein
VHVAPGVDDDRQRDLESGLRLCAGGVEQVAPELVFDRR